MTIQSKLAMQLRRPWGRISYVLLKLLGVEIPRTVRIGQGFQLPHGAVGLVVHPRTVIGSNVKLFGGVTLGRADSYHDATAGGEAPPGLINIVVEDDVIVGSGAKVLFSASKAGSIRIGKGSVIAANAVVLQDVPPGEVWGGIPARPLHR